MSMKTEVKANEIPPSQTEEKTVSPSVTTTEPPTERKKPGPKPKVKETSPTSDSTNGSKPAPASGPKNPTPALKAPRVKAQAQVKRPKVRTGLTFTLNPALEALVRPEAKEVLDQAAEALSLFIRKNSNYGGTFLLSKGGMAAHQCLFVGRLADKFERLNVLLGTECGEHVGESIEDTARDLSNYALMLIVARRHDLGGVNRSTRSKKRK